MMRSDQKQFVAGSNLLPYDGEVYYFGQIFTAEETGYYFDKLMREIAWKNDEAILFGRHYITRRKVAWYADHIMEYAYSNITKTSLTWTETLLEIKHIVTEVSGDSYNSCLLNLYHSGEEGMAWHSDGEKDLKKHGAIASVSFGAERKFAFKHKKTKGVTEISLPTGSLLVMKGITQDHWWHRLPPSKKVKEARINLTFRTITGR